jgi:hypothetical protein
VVQGADWVNWALPQLLSDVSPGTLLQGAVAASHSEPIAAFLRQRSRLERSAKSQQGDESSTPPTIIGCASSLSYLTPEPLSGKGYDIIVLVNTVVQAELLMKANCAVDSRNDAHPKFISPHQRHLLVFLLPSSWHLHLARGEREGQKAKRSLEESHMRRRLLHCAPVRWTADWVHIRAIPRHLDLLWRTKARPLGGHVGVAQ